MNESDTVDRVDGAAPSQGLSIATATLTREVDPLSVTKRLQRDGRWPEVEPVRNRMIKECRKQGMSKADAQAWTYTELDRLYPPEVTDSAEPSALATSDQGVSGLGDLPDEWPTLPANASLQAEISWVSANRLRVRSGKGVDLARALSPPPSYSALSWLETSILFPSKFADISVKATADQNDEREHIKREKMAIEEIRSILKEMLSDKTP